MGPDNINNPLANRWRQAQTNSLDFLKGANASAASTVSAPIDLIAMLLNKAGANIKEPVGGSDWMKRKGLMEDPTTNAGYVGNALAGVLPMVAAAKAPQIANALNQAGANALAPATMARAGERGVLRMSEQPAWAEDFGGIGGKLNQDGTVTVYHRTTPEAADAIKKSGVMRGAEDGLFFSSSLNGQAAGYGDGVVELRIPASKLQLDDLFDNEAHFRLPTKRIGQPVFISDWLKK